MNNLIILTKLVIEEYKNSKALSEQKCFNGHIKLNFCCMKKGLKYRSNF